MKKLIAVWGVANRGKSTTIRMACKKIVCELGGRVVKERILNGNGDKAVVIAVNGQKLGMLTQSEMTCRDFFKHLERFEKCGCQLIVCATRTKGGTVCAAEIFSTLYKYEEKDGGIEMCDMPSDEQRQARNQSKVKEILKAVRDLVGNGDGKVYK